VRSLASSPDRAGHQAHFAQDRPHLLRHGGNIPPLVAASRGADVRVIGLSWPDFREPVLTLPGSGIEHPGDLRGRRLAVPRRLADTIDFWRPTVLHGYERALAVAGLTLDDVDLVDLPIERSLIDAPAPGDRRGALWGARALLGQQREEAVALLTGRVDAIFSHGALAPIAQGVTGARTVVDLGALPQRPDRVNNGIPQVLTATGDLLDAHPEAVARILARVVAVGAWARAVPERARDAIAAEIGLPLDLLDDAHGPAVHAQLDVDLAPERVAALTAQAAWLHRRGVMDGPLDVAALVDPRPLERARRILGVRSAPDPIGVGA
jgi:ABC-type nitrate/sulfonate/bicarbonate transport system substrate-binding protein